MDQKTIIDFWASEAEESLHVAKHLFEKKEFRKKCTKQFTATELRKIKEVFTWLKSNL